MLPLDVTWICFAWLSFKLVAGIGLKCNDADLMCVIWNGFHLLGSFSSCLLKLGSKCSRFSMKDEFLPMFS